jgi:hypothetical protein
MLDERHNFLLSLAEQTSMIMVIAGQIDASGPAQVR